MLEVLERGRELVILTHDPPTPVLVIVPREHVLPRMREWTVPDVVQQRGDLHVPRERRIELEPPGHALRDMEGAERMPEARVLRARIHEPRKAHLLDAPQPLDGRGLEQFGERAILALELDEAMHRVAKDAVLHRAERITGWRRRRVRGKPLRMRLLVALVLVVGCSSKEPVKAGTGSGSTYQALGKKPANARRPTAPPNIEAKALAVGAKAPSFEVTDATGARWRLADALAKHGKLILVFYRGDWCPYCRTQLGELQANLPELAKRNIGLAAMSVDEPMPGKVLAERLSLTFPLLSDVGGGTLKSFGVFDDDTEIAWPAIFVINADGTILQRWLADTFKQRIATADLLRELDKH